MRHVKWVSGCACLHCERQRDCSQQARGSFDDYESDGGRFNVVIKPEIDSLLQKTEQNPRSLASKRACDNVLHGQHLRVTAVQDFDDDMTTVASGRFCLYCYERE